MARFFYIFVQNFQIQQNKKSACAFFWLSLKAKGELNLVLNVMLYLS